MLSLSQIDAAVRRVRYYNPDLELEILFLDDAELKPEDVVKIAHIRTALVARVADIVNQASNSSQALDAAVSTAEILISSYNGYGDRPGRGHKHALQAIRLLASIPKRFDTATDLFFDLVERSCAHSQGQGKFQGAAVGRSSANATRMMQNYDQTLAKLISRQWSKGNGFIRWNVQAPIDRIKTLRQIYDYSDNMSVRSVRTFSRRRQYMSTTIFSESERILHQIRKASTELVWAVWARSIRAQLRFWSKKKEPFDPTLTSASTASTFSETESNSPASMDARRKFTPRDAEAVDMRQQVDMVYGFLDEDPHTKYLDAKALEMDAASSYTFSDDAHSLRSHRTDHAKHYHAT